MSGVLAFELTPYADESINGYLVRLTEENFVGSVNTLMSETGVRFKALYSPTEAKAVAKGLGLDSDLIVRLGAYEQVKGQLGLGRFLRKAAVPVCVPCLKEHGYIRQAWHCELVTCCPEHNCLLQAECPDCRDALDLKRPTVRYCRCGCDLTDVPVVDAAPADLFITRLLMGQVDATSLGLSSEPENLDAFLFYLANIQRDEPYRKNGAISWAQARELVQASHYFASDLLPRFRAFAKERVEAANERDSIGFMPSLGSWYKEMNTQFSDAAYGPVRTVAYEIIVKHAVAPLNRKMKQIGAELLGVKGALTVAEAARMLKSSPDRVIAAVKTGELAGTTLQGAANEYSLVQRADVDAHRTAAEDFIDGKEVLKILSITRRVKDRLTEAGVLCPVSRAERPLFARGHYRKSEAFALLDKLSVGCPDISCADVGLTLTEISGKKFADKQAAELFRQIFQGQIKPMGRVKGIPGLAGFRFDEDDIRIAEREDPALRELTITELSKLTGWKHETIKGWVDGGFLQGREVEDRKHGMLVGLPELITFLSTYAVSADAAARLGSKSVWLMKPLNAAGVVAEGAHETSASTQRGVLFSIDALINVASNKPAKWRRVPVRTTEQKRDLDWGDLADSFRARVSNHD